MKGKLSIVPSPIGNLEDITFRALRVLREADAVLCEDTRHSAPLLNHYAIQKTLISYHEHNEQSRSEEILKRLKEGENFALISDAGFPGVSDPGAVLIRKALKENLPVEVLPGSSASITALVFSGFSGGSFYFHGFLSRKHKEREEEKERIKKCICPVILYESPKRLKSTLEELEEFMPGRKAAVIRELTKIYEERIFGTLPEVLEKLPENVKGEIVLILGPYEEKKNFDLEGALKNKLRQGISMSRAVKEVTKESGLPKNEVYAYGLKLKGEEDDGIFF